MPLVGRVQPLAVAVEGVGVLHDELARPQHAGAGPGLVALLDLKVVEDQRQVPVGLDRRGHMTGDDLLVGHGQHQVGAAAVLELQQPVDSVAPGAGRQGSAWGRTRISISWPPIAFISSRTISTTRW